MPASEINFDGIVGPTHNYAGLSWGNVASMTHKSSVSNPRQAALQGLEKMKSLMDLGVKQAILPPHERPHLPTLRALGFSGSDAEILLAAQRNDPTLLAAVCSASAMWAANAATVSPSPDTADHRVHFTPANLVSTFHRSLESATTTAVLKRIFADELRFCVHAPLPSGMNFADEGAANHTRLFSGKDGPGIEIFAFGRHGLEDSATRDTKFPARQTRQASQAVSRLHQISSAATFFVKQNPRAIDAGAFHNDVVSVGHRDVLMIHASAWENQSRCLDNIASVFRDICGQTLLIIEIAEDEISLPDAIKTYLFNSQLVTLPDGFIGLIAPIECAEHAGVRRAIDRIIASKNPISEAHFVNLRQSMHNGGGPACLRLRVTLTEDELAAMHPGVLLTTDLYQRLRAWVGRRYRDELRTSDLADPELLQESRAALDELTEILDLGSIYSFQSSAG